MLPSVDRVANVEGGETFDPEFLNSINEVGMPEHLLRLKVGVPVTLLRYLEAPRLCNGTNLRLTHVSTRVMKGEIMGGKHSGKEVLIPRIPLQSKDNNRRMPCPFIRMPFPVRLAFAMTINKAQGQSMKHIGVDLQSSEVFSHGQLYVALSRATGRDHLPLIGPPTTNFVQSQMVSNVVRKEVLMPR